MMKTDKKKSRGMINNNPFNLKEGPSDWLGEITGPDEVFEEFVRFELGVRAGLINLYNIYFSRGLTVRKIIERYAPKEDKNDTEAYIQSVSRIAGVKSEEIPLKSKWLDISSAILKVENGFPVMSPDGLRLVVYDFNLKNYML